MFVADHHPLEQLHDLAQATPDTDPGKFLPDLPPNLPIGQDEAIPPSARRPHRCSSPITTPWNNSTISSRPFPSSDSGDASRPSSSPNRDGPPRTSPTPWDAHSRPSRTGSLSTIAGGSKPSTSDRAADVRHGSTPRSIPG